MRICVTGGAGYIGAALVERLRVKGHEVDVIDWIVGKDLFHVRHFDYDIVYHLAALAGVGMCLRHPDDFVWRMNSDACGHIAKCCSNDTLIVYSSTSAISAKTSTYSLTKRSGEIVLFDIHKKSVALRLATIYGISSSMRDGLLVNDLVRSAVRDGYIVAWEEDTVRPYMTIGDCTRLLASFASGKHSEHYGSVVKAFDDALMRSKGEVAKIIKNVTGCELFHSNRQDIYPQNTVKYKGLFNFGNAKPISEETIKPIVEYYERQYPATFYRA